MNRQASDTGWTDGVVVVGAGIAGLALTRELCRRDVPVVTLEHRPQLVDAGLAINLPGNAIAALRELGLGDDLHHYGAPIMRREYRMSSGRLLFQVDEGAFWGTDNTPRCMRRSDLASLLIKDVPIDAVLRRCSVALASLGEDSVQVTTSEGEQLTGSYVVGADGVHSTVRQRCFPDSMTSVAQLGQASWRFIAANPGVDCWTVWLGKKAIVLLIPIGPEEVYCWATITADAQSSRDPAALLRYTNDFEVKPRRVLEQALKDPSAMFNSPLNEIRLPGWSRGRAILIGDAAHATAPVWAQGAALAMEDSLVLADLLARDMDPRRIGQEFERLRQTRVRHVQAVTDRASKISRLPAFLRNAMMAFMGPLSYKSAYGPLRTPIYTLE